MNSVSYEYRNNSDIMGAVPLEMTTLFKNTTLHRTNVLSIKKCRLFKNISFNILFMILECFFTKHDLFLSKAIY